MSETSPPGPDWVRDAIFYQIFPERFDNADPASDPEGVVAWGTPPSRDNLMGGDLPGITRRLGHIQSLGANAIYLTPVFSASTNHRYDATDYYSIDPRLGGEPAFADFVGAAHDRDIRVVLDAVFNHCGYDHPFFQDVIAHGEQSAYVNWFSVEQFPVSATPEPNYLTCSGCWYLPKLNVRNPQVRDHLFGAAQKWMNAGIDGWRLDVPFMLDNPLFWEQFRAVVKGHSTDQYIVAEVWEKATEWATGETSDAAMNYRLRDAILSFVSEWRGGGETLAADLEAIDREIPAAAKGLMLNLLGSHDTERVLTHCGGDVAAAKLAYALLFTAEGAPMVYYGDEIGMSGFNDPDCRGAMNWNKRSWNNDLLDWIRTLAHIRHSSVALRRGTEHTLQATENTIVRSRSHPDDEVLVLVNRARTEAEISVSSHVGRHGTDLINAEYVDCGHVLVPGMGVRVVQLH
ncbi:MAG: glycoside hydrolase family 13 protein [Mycobacteriales bacterium]